MGFGDLEIALRARDLIKSLVKSEVDSQRPRLQYATVMTIDRINRKCGVKFPGESSTMTVNMGSIQPSAVGQTVRIDGLTGDRFVSDVLGKPFVDNANSGMEKQPVRTATSANITLSGLQTIEGVVLVAGDRVLVREQTTSSQNGIYNAAVGTWTRASDADTFDKVQEGTRVAVDEGNLRHKIYTQFERLTSLSSNQFWRVLSIIEGVGAFTYPGPQVGGHMVFDTNDSVIRMWNGLGWQTSNQFTECTSGTRPSFVNDGHRIYETDTGRFGHWDGAWVMWDTVEFAQQARFMARARQYIQGGGLRTVTSSGVSWSQRFIVTSVGRGSFFGTDGYFNIELPSDTTVITKYGLSGGGTATVSGGIVPLAVSEALWYEIPLGSASASQNGNFRITSNSADFEVPDNWVKIVSRRANDTTDSLSPDYMWGDGQQDSYWRALSLQNSWINYGAGFNSAEYRKMNGLVYVRGLIKNGSITSNIVLGNLPAGYRPAQAIIYPSISAAVSGNNDWASLQVSSNGDLVGRRVIDNSFLSIESMPFKAEL